MNKTTQTVSFLHKTVTIFLLGMTLGVGVAYPTAAHAGFFDRIVNFFRGGSSDTPAAVITPTQIDTSTNDQATDSDSDTVAPTQTTTNVINTETRVVERVEPRNEITREIVREVVPDERLNFLTSAIGALENRVGTFSSIPVRVSSNQQTIALTNKIDQLTGVTLNNIKVNGVSGLRDADLPKEVTFRTAVIGSATTTNATSTDFYTSKLTAVWSTLTNLLATNATTTNLFATSSQLVLADITNATSSTLFATSSTLVNSSITNLIAANASSTNLYANIFNAITASTTDLLTRTFNVNGSATSTFAAGIRAAGYNGTYATLQRILLGDGSATSTVTGGATTTFSGGLQAAALNLTGGLRVNGSGTSTFTGALDTAGVKTGTLEVTGGSTSTIASGLSVGTTQVNGGLTVTSAGTSTFTGKVAASGLTTGTFNVSGSGTSSFTGGLIAPSIQSADLNVTDSLFANTASSTLVRANTAVVGDLSTNSLTIVGSGTSTFVGGLKASGYDGLFASLQRILLGDGAATSTVTGGATTTFSGGLASLGLTANRFNVTGTATSSFAGGVIAPSIQSADLNVTDSLFANTASSTLVRANTATVGDLTTNSLTVAGSGTSTFTGGVTAAGLASSKGLHLTGGALRLGTDAITDFTGDGLTVTGGALGLNVTGGTGITYTAGGTFDFDCSEVEGTGINCAGENITLDATGDWTGTFDGQEGTYYLSRANHTGTQNLSTISNYDFTFATNYGVRTLTASTTLPLWAQGGIYASSTSRLAAVVADSFSVVGAGTSTVTGGLSVGLLNSAGLYVATSARSTFTGPVTTGSLTTGGLTLSGLFTSTASGTSTLTGGLSVGLLSANGLSVATSATSSFSAGLSAQTLAAINASVTNSLVANGIASQFATSTFATSTKLFATTASSTNLFSTAATLGGLTASTVNIGGKSFNNLAGTGLQVIGSALTLDATGDWTGTFDGQEGSFYLANSFATSSADFWKSQNNFYSTTSANYWLTTKTTDNLTQGAANKYYSTALFTTDLAAVTALPNVQVLANLVDATSTHLFATELAATEATSTRLFASFFNGGEATTTRLSVVNGDITVYGGNIETQGCVAADSDDNSGAAGVSYLGAFGDCVDLAEGYEAGEYLLPATIVAAADDAEAREGFSVVKATRERAGATLGIVSTRPAIFINGDRTSFGGTKFNSESVYDRGDVVPLALAGRVQVKVNGQNGTIAIGDAISLSSTPGVGKKAAPGELTIGVALESSQVSPTGEDSILVYVSRGSQQLTVTSLTDLLPEEEEAPARVNDLGGIYRIDDGKVVFTELTVDGAVTIGTSEHPRGITLYDTYTGAAYCLEVSNGDLKHTYGACGGVVNESVAANQRAREAEVAEPTEEETEVVEEETTEEETLEEEVVVEEETTEESVVEEETTAPEEEVTEEVVTPEEETEVVEEETTEEETPEEEAEVVEEVVIDTSVASSTDTQ